MIMEILRGDNMSYLNSQIIIAKTIKNDRNYTNVYDGDMLAVVNSAGHFVASSSTYSFIRDDGSISTDFSYSQALQCNYVAFQNPDYANRWFFGWIDHIEYKGERNIRIHYTIDYWSTWYNSLVKNPVFVEREHVALDSFGSHTLPEPVKPGMLINQNITNKYYTSFSIIVFWVPQQITSAEPGYAINNIYYTPVNVNRYDCSQSGLNNLFIDFSTGSLANSTVICVNVIPNNFIPVSAQTIKNIPPEMVTIEDTINFTLPQHINGYQPVNNKCFLYPYNMVSVNNGNSEKVLKYEKFSGIALLGGELIISGGIMPNGGASIYPIDYDGRSGKNVAESLTLGDFPMVAVPSDSYAAWLAQKSSGVVIQGILNTLTGAIAGGLKGGVAGAAAGGSMGLVGGVTNYISQEEAARTERDSITGTNNVDLDLINGLMGFSISQKCCRFDDIKRIDFFFSQFGYNVSETKTPNYTGREYWNYVKINGNAGYGEMPENAREEINRILNSGTTIWHNEANMGNYFVGGSKMENPTV